MNDILNQNIPTGLKSITECYQSLQIRSSENLAVTLQLCVQLLSFIREDYPNLNQLNLD